ncbi:MAG: hypothetical protein B0D86_07045, partial [Candidatus Sedimenticola endophacoides]
SLDVTQVLAWKREHGTVVGMPGTQSLTNQGLLELPCDILIPAAMGNQITQENAPRIQARLVVEAANRPVSPEADDILTARGIPLLPDILANAGGVAVSYFEWVQNIENQEWHLDEVNRKLREKMVAATDAVVARWRAVGAEVFDTARSGAILYHSEWERPRRYRCRHGRYWQRQGVCD